MSHLDQLRDTVAQLQHAPYWLALCRLDRYLGGPGELWSPKIDQLTTEPPATVASVANIMRKAAADDHQRGR